MPEDIPSGTYWSVLFFDSEVPRSEEEAGQGIAIQSRVRVGHIIYVEVGQPTREGTIVDIRYSEDSPPGTVRVRFGNTGTGLLRVDGRTEIRTMTGELLQTLEVTDVASFPGATHDLTFPLEEPLDSGRYLALTVLDFGEASVVVGEAEVAVP